MPDIIETIGDPAANSYLSLEAADEAMDGFPNARKWLNLSEADRQRALLDATRKVDRYKGWTPQTATQALAFPSSRDPEGVLPREVTNAVLEILDFEASGEMKSLKKLQAEGVTSRSIMGQSSQFKADESQMPAGARRELDGLWRLYSSPILVQDRVKVAGKPGTTTGSLFKGDLRTPR